MANVEFPDYMKGVKARGVSPASRTGREWR